MLTGTLLTASSAEALAQTPLPCFTFPAGVTITRDTTWSTPQRIHGTVRVQSGAILTIDSTTVEFDDTENMPDNVNLTANQPSRIVVEAGSMVQLYASHLKPLTARSGCATAAMWDGIVLLGDPTDPQGTQPDNVRDPNQGKLHAVGSTIEQARVGVLMGTSGYAGNQLAVSASTANGGGWGRIYSTVFLNCHTGVYLTTYRPTGGNRTIVGGCTFRADAPLGSAAYTSQGVVPGTQYGVRGFEVGRSSILNCVFELLDGTSAFGNVALPYQLRGHGLSSTASTFSVSECIFRNLYRGVWAIDPVLAFPMAVSGCTFEGNIEGVTLSGVLAPVVRDNTFRIGRGTFQFPYGLSLYGSPAHLVYNNTFLSTPAAASPGPGCANNECPYARGLNVTQVDGPDTLNPIANEIYRNSFSYLSTGIYVQRGAANTLLRCNSFRGAGTRRLDATLSRADIELYIGNLTTAAQRDMLRNRVATGDSVTGHGECDPDQARAANNFFSYTGGSARSILVMHTPNLPTLLYNYTSDPAEQTAPLSYTAYSSGVSSGVVPNACDPVNFNYDIACPSVDDPGRTPGVLRAILDTISDPNAYSTTLNELLRAYLHDTTGIAALPKAFARLQKQLPARHNRHRRPRQRDCGPHDLRQRGLCRYRCRAARSCRVPTERVAHDRRADRYLPAHYQYQQPLRRSAGVAGSLCG